MSTKNYYTVWSWLDTPYAIRMSSPLEEDGTWIVRIEPGYDFPHENLSVVNHPKWEVKQKRIDGRWYAFIKDPESLLWPEFDPSQFDFMSHFR